MDKVQCLQLEKKHVFSSVDWWHHCYFVTKKTIQSPQAIFIPTVKIQCEQKQNEQYRWRKNSLSQLHMY